MSTHHIYKKIELVGSSNSSIEDAIQNALTECHKTIKNMDWFEVTETRGHITNGAVAHYQVTLKVGFRIEGS
jgi:dodecin